MQRKKEKEKEKGKAGEIVKDKVGWAPMGLSGVWTALDGFALMCIVPSIARFFACFCKLIFSCVCIFAPPSPYKCAIYRCKIARTNTLMAHPGTLPGTLTCARNFLNGVCHIRLHWGGFGRQCRHIYIPYMECLGNTCLKYVKTF